MDSCIAWGKSSALAPRVHCPSAARAAGCAVGITPCSTRFASRVHSRSECTTNLVNFIDDDNRGIPGKNRTGQLLRGQLSAVLGVEAGLLAKCLGRSECRPPAKHAAGPVPAHSFLPQALQVLLFPRLHR